MRRLKLEFDPDRNLFEPVILEEHVVTEIIDRLWLQAKIKMWRVRERIPDNRKRRQQLSTPGIPDLIGWIPRHMIQTDDNPFGLLSPCPVIPLFIEVKRPGGVRRIAQQTFIQEAVDGGCCAFFAECWGDVVRELEKFGIKLYTEEKSNESKRA